MFSEEFKKKGYKSATLLKKDFKLNVGRSMSERHDPRYVTVVGECKKTGEREYTL